MSSLAVAASQHRSSTTRRTPQAVRRREAPSASASVAIAESFGLVLVIALIVLSLFVTAAHVAAPSASARVRVEAGQTLWTIAADHPVAGLTTEQTADLIAQLNHVDSQGLCAGATLRVPVQPAVDGVVAVAMR